MQNRSCVSQEISPQIVVNVVTMKKVSFLILYLAWEGFSHVNCSSTSFCMSTYLVEHFKRVQENHANTCFVGYL